MSVIYTIKCITIFSTDHLLILISEDSPDYADRDTKYCQEQHPDLGTLVKIWQVVVWDSEKESHQSYSCLYIASSFINTLKHEAIF